MKDNLKIIQSTIKILDGYSKLYGKVSHNRFGNYLNYMMEGNFSDEDDFIKPKLWNDFLLEILKFPKDEFLSEFSPTAETPDFIPGDTNIHSFIFEIKGTDTKDLSSHFNKLSIYIKTCGVKWGVITNMRELEVYESLLQSPLQEYSFSFLELYKNYKSHPKVILDYQNTKKFLAFVRQFSYKGGLGMTKKIEIIKKARKWTGEEKLNPILLTDSIRRVVNTFYSDTVTRSKELSLSLRFDPGRKKEIENELETIACELDRARKSEGKHLKEFMSAEEGSIEHRAFTVYLYRVAYFAMTRILLARMWEDTGFIPESLYNGGFNEWYERLQREVERVLNQAFHFAGDKYYWLYSVPNNYHWYVPNNEALVDVLYEFSKYNLSKLNTDVLGKVYEEYVDRVDRKNKGQYYTPREIIGLIWDRVGYKDDDSFFVYENGKRKPRLVFDPCTGSGGFLVEAARRLIETSHYNDNDIDDLIEIMFALVDGLCGSEISLFSHYITEVNLLIQLTPLFKKIFALLPRQYRFPEFTLSVVPCDALGLHNPRAVLVNSAEIKESPEEYSTIMALHDPHKRVVYNKIMKEDKFYYVCSNPPYVREKEHKEVFRTVLQKYPNYWWRNFYKGKMDYLYFFIVLGLSKLKEGGKLGFITTSYWPAADGASKLREYILKNALIKEIINFGEVKIFEGAKGQHNMVFILEKCPDKRKAERTMVKMDVKENIERKKNHRIKIVIMKKRFEGKDHKEKMRNMVEWVEKYIDRDEYEDDYVDIFYSAVKQGELTDGAWNLTYSSSTGQILDKIETIATPISDLYEIDCGIFSNADYLNEKYIELIPRQRREELNIKPNDGIFVLSKDEAIPLLKDDSKKEIIKRTYKNSDISPYFIETEPLRYLLYIDDSFNPSDFPSITRHLEKFKEVLIARLTRYGENYPWWRLHRPHKRNIYENPKIVTSRWGKENTYALQTGDFFENSDINLYIPRRDTKESIKYTLGLLNSRLLNYWVTYKGRGEGVSRQIRLKQIPIHSINFNDKKEAKAHNKLVDKVDKIIKLKKEIAEYNKFYSRIKITRIDKLEAIPEPDEYLLTKNLPDEDKRNIRTHQKVIYEPQKPGDFYLSGIGNIESAPLSAKEIDEPLFSILLKGKDKKCLRITAPREIIEYLSKVLSGYKNKSWDEIKEIPIAKDLETFISKKKEVSSRVQFLLTQIQNLQREIDEIVYDLYGMNKKERRIIEEAVKS